MLGIGKMMKKMGLENLLLLMAIIMKVIGKIIISMEQEHIVINQDQKVHKFLKWDKFVGEWKNDKKHGKGKVYNENNELIESGEWEDGNKIKDELVEKVELSFEKLTITKNNFFETYDITGLSKKILTCILIIK